MVQMACSWWEVSRDVLAQCVQEMGRVDWFWCGLGLAQREHW